MSLRAIPGSLAAKETVKLQRDFLGHLTRLHQQHGDVFKTNIGVPAVFWVGPEANRAILSSHADEFSLKDGYADSPLAELFAGSLLTQDNAEAMRERAWLKPALGPQATAASVDVVYQMWRQSLSALDDGRSHDVHALCAKVGFDAAMVVQLGLDPDEDAFQRIHPLVQKVVRGARSSSSKDRVFKDGMRAREELIQLLMARVEAAARRPPRGVVGALIQQRDESGAALDVRRIAENLVLLFWASYDTFSASAAWVLYELARSPEWQARLRQERERELGEVTQLSMDQLRRLPQHMWVVREIERLRPVGVFFPRRLRSEAAAGPHLLPKGTLVCYSAYLTHRLERLFSEPDRFAPERWSESSAQAGGIAHLVGFGGGPRVCLGKSFAQMQLVVILCVLGGYRLEPDLSVPERIVTLPAYRPENAHVRFVRHRSEG